VVAISASVIDMDRETLRQSGFDDFLGKPFREGQLFELISRMAGLRFRYREAEGEAPVPKALSELLRLESAAWRADLKEAVLIGDTQAALALADQMGTKPVAESLRQLLKAYKLQELLDGLNG
jgi:CheY-like chemotaxis protein